VAVTYTKVAFPKIEERLRNIINEEFKNVYISSRFENMGSDESIRIFTSSSNLLEHTQYSEVREYTVSVRHYYNEPDSIRREEYVKNRIDRLKKLIMGNISSAGNYYDLHIDGIQYDVQDVENENNPDMHITELEAMLKNYNKWS